jgi:adenylate cyclase
MVDKVATMRVEGPMADAAIAEPSIDSSGLSRKQLAVIAADIADYSRLTEAAEESTHARIRALRVDVIDPAVVTFRGRVVRNTGDGFLAAFDSALDAVRCAMEIQREISASESSEAADRQIQFRIGINIGDVIIEPEDIYGTSVNIAARLEQCAPAGGVVISSEIRDRIASRVDVPMDDLGSLRLKNISRPIQAFSLAIPSAKRGGGTARKRTSKRAKVPSIVVLPFRTVGDDGSDSYFGDGMVEDIIVALASVRGLLVISRTSALAFRTGAIDIRKVGQELGVRYVLSGTVRRAAGRLSIVAQLSDVETGEVIWADRYEGQQDEIFDFQARIATRIVWSVAPHVREAELKRAMRKRPSSMNAYDLVMQAIDLMYRMNFDDFARAGKLLQSAIEADDSYATAHAYGALWHVHNVAQGWAIDQKADSLEAARLAAAAVERDPADGFALAIHGHIKAYLFHDYDAAISTFDRALNAAPGNAMVWSFSSAPFSYTGNARIGIERAEHGLRLSPVDTQAHFYLTFLALAHYVAGSYDEAVIWARKGADLNSQLCATLRILTASLVGQGSLDEARHFGQMHMKIQPRFQLSAYAQLCPYLGEIGTGFMARLRTAGLPD